MLSRRGPARTFTVRLAAEEEEALAIISREMSREGPVRWARRSRCIRAAIHHYRRHLQTEAEARANQPLAEVLDDE